MLLFDIYLIAAVFPAMGAYAALFGGKSMWYMLFIPLFYLTAVAILDALHFVIAFFWSLVIKKSPVPEHPSKLYMYLTVSTIDIIDRYAGIKTQGFDTAALPAEPCLIVCNHLSNFDSMLTAVYLKKRKLCYISKKDNFRIPIAGSFINKAGYLCIDRNDPRKALQTVHAAVKRLKNGMDVGVYPEGTRSKNGKTGEFKEGIFLIAKKAGVNVVVLSVLGSSMIHKNVFRRFTNVKLKLAGIIDKDTVAACRPAVLSKIAKEMVEKSL